MFILPPIAREASNRSRYGTRSVSSRRCSERCVHSGERAGSTLCNSATSPCTAAAACVPTAGRPSGSESTSRTWRSSASGARITSLKLEVSTSPAAWAAECVVASFVGSANSGGAGASRVRSRNCIDSATPPWPSVTVWCSFWMSALRPPSSPSTITNCHSGRERSKASLATSVVRSCSWRIEPG